MVKVKVLIPFNDKHTGKKYQKNDIVEMSAKRINEVLEKGKYIQLVETENTAEKEKK